MLFLVCKQAEHKKGEKGGGLAYFNSSQLCIYICDNWIYAMNTAANSFQQPVFPKHELTPTTTAEKSTINTVDTAVSVQTEMQLQHKMSV